MAPEEVAGDVGAVHLEALICAGVLMGEAHVVEHGAGIKQLGIKAETAALAGECAPVIDAARMVEQQRRLGVPDQFGYFACQLGIGDEDACDRAGRRFVCV